MIGSTSLELNGLSVRFGGLQALDQLSFTLQQGEIFGLIGPNGAGKTTLFNVITGLTAATSGEVRWQGKTTAGLRPDQLCNLGIARTFQNLRVFSDLSCIDNLQLAMGC